MGINKELEISLNKAFHFAHENQHKYVTLEHLLYALLDNIEVRVLLNQMTIDVVRLRGILRQHVNKFNRPQENEDYVLLPSPAFDRVIKRAVAQSQHIASGNKIVDVGGIDVLAALFSEKDSASVVILSEQGVNFDKVREFYMNNAEIIKHSAMKKNKAQQAPQDKQIKEEEEEAPSFLSQFTVDLVEKAAQGKIDPVIGREEEILRMAQILGRRKKNNPILVGEPGVGKTAVVEGLALAIHHKKVPEKLKSKTIYALDMMSLIAGTKYRGDFEKRLQGLINEIKELESSILFIDEVHSLIGAGATSGNSVDAANLLKPILNSGEVQCIGSTTYKEYRTVFEKESALSRRFQKIDILEPSKDDCVEILKVLRKNYEKFHNVKYTDDAINSSIDLTVRYIPDRFLPDKAIDIIDEVGALQGILPKEKRKKNIGAKQIAEVISKAANIPITTISKNDVKKIIDLEKGLKKVIFGQDEAIKQLSYAMKIAYSGLNQESRPIASFLFFGPTGVGKTELTKQLADLAGIKMLRFDMSEYMEKHAVSRLIGAPPGYVGFEQQSILGDSVMKHPYSLLLFDEIEKAHPDVYNIFLQMLDYGTVTDNNGSKINFKNTVIIFTTNAGAEQTSKENMGFIKQDNSSDMMKIIEQQFRPELRNRLDAIIQFKSLGNNEIGNIVDKQLDLLQLQLDPKNIQLKVSQKARDWLILNGFDDKMGARPMNRLISNQIRQPLSEIILGSNFKTKTSVNVDISDDDNLKLLVDEPSKKSSFIKQVKEKLNMKNKVSIK